MAAAQQSTHQLDAHRGPAAGPADGVDAVAHLDDAEELEIGEVDVAEGVGGFGVVEEVVGVVGEEQDEVGEGGQRLGVAGFEEIKRDVKAVARNSRARSEEGLSVS